MTFLEHVKNNALNGFDLYDCIGLEEAFEKKDAVVFIYAQWSATAVHCWRTLTEVLSGIENLPLLVYVINTDSLDRKTLEGFSIDLPQGKGETYWIRNGEEISKLASYTKKDGNVLLSNTTKLLNS